jgi:hypothetical protein
MFRSCSISGHHGRIKPTLDGVPARCRGGAIWFIPGRKIEQVLQGQDGKDSK